MFKKHTYFELFFAVIAGLVATGLVLVWLRSARPGATLVDVVALSHDISAPTKLAVSDLTIIQIPKEAVPNGAFASVAEVVGQGIPGPAVAKKIIVQTDLITRDPSSDSLLVPAGKIGLVIPSAWLSSPLPRARKNDTVTILGASVGTNITLGNQGVIVSRAPILDTRGERAGAPETIFIAVTPATAGALLQARANGFALAAVIDASAAPAPATTTPAAPKRK